jgi:transposase
MLTHLVLTPEQIELNLKSIGPSAICPSCQTPSFKIHCYYTRHLSDLGWAEKRVHLLLKARRFVCPNSQCSKRTFAERLGQEIGFYARRTQRCQAKLKEIGLVLGGRAGARLAQKLGLPISRDTLLGILTENTSDAYVTPRVLGVDDFAFRKGSQYGTILVDLERRKPIEMLPDRQTATFANWLQLHPGVEIISRERSGTYAEAARMAAPQALQVADRFHLAKNLSETLERIMRRYYPLIQKELVGNLLEGAPSLSQLPPKRGEAEKEHSQAKRLAVYTQVMALHQKGYKPSEISAQLKMSRRKVMALLQAPPQPPVYKKRASQLDPYKSYLAQRFFEEGCDNSLALFREISQRGYQGGSSAVTTYLTQLRLQKGTILAKGQPLTTRPRLLERPLPTPRTLSWWFILPAQRLNKAQKSQLKQLRENLPQLGQVYKLARRFSNLMHHKQAASLDNWLVEVRQSQIAELQSFGEGLRRDIVAVKNGIELEWSQGPVEGHVNRLKLIKRSMYGRAGFDLLRTRVLAA